jgi:hypothetical protein
VDPARVAEETKRVSTRLERCKLILELESLPSEDAQEPSNHAPISTLPLPSSLLLEPKPPTAYQAKLGKAEEKIKEQATQLKDQATAMEELNRQLSSLNALGAGQLGARKNLPPPQHAQVPGSGNWKPPGAAIAPPPASAPAPPAAKTGRPPAPPPAAAAVKKTDPLARIKKKYNR